MKKPMEAIKCFWKDEEGATAVEYGIMVALIAVAIITAVNTVGINLANTFFAVADEVPGTASPIAAASN